MLLEDLEKLLIIRNGQKYMPKFTSEIKKDDNGNFYTDYTIIKSAEENYNDIKSIKENGIPQEPTEQEKINAQLLKDNAEQKILIAQLTKEIASLKGGTTNV